FEYLPPVDVDFGDFLRALITADYELVPADPDLRDAMIEAFRNRGIYPDGVNSLAEESVLWPTPAPALPPIGTETTALLQDLFFQAIRSFDTGGWQSPTNFTLPPSPPEQYTDLDQGEEIRVNLNSAFATQLARYASSNAAALGLEANSSRKV